MAHEIWADYAGGAYSDSTFEYSFKADLYVASLLHGQIVYQLHHGFRSAGVDGIEASFLQHVFDDFWHLVLLPIGSIIGGEEELEVVILAFPEQPFLEQELARRSRTGDQCDISSSQMDEERDQGNKTCSAAYNEEFVVVSHAERVAIWASDPELVANFLLPEGSANWSTLLDYDPRLGPSMNR